jgi:hypothetical protein
MYFLNVCLNVCPVFVSLVDVEGRLVGEVLAARARVLHAVGEKMSAKEN